MWMRLALLSEVAVTDESLVQVRLHDENHSNDWSSAFVGQDYTFRKLQDRVDRRRRSLLGRERAANAVRLAARHAALGGRASALRAISRSMPFSWRYSRWWSGALRVVLRTLLPARLLVLSHRRGDSAA